MELEIQGRHYVSMSKLDAFTQLHLARKLGSALPVVGTLVDNQNAEKEKTILMVLLLSNISDADADFVVKKCLSVVGRKQAGGQAAKLQSADGTLMFDDTPMSDLLALTEAILEENLGDFFRTSLANLAVQAE